MTFSTPIEKVKNVGEAHLKGLKELGIKNIGNLIYYFPREYRDFSKISKISQAKVNEKICVRGKIMSLGQKKTWTRHMSVVNAVISDESGSIEAAWFNQPYLSKSLKVGDEIIAAGKISLNKGRLIISAPIFEKILPREMLHLGRIAAVYPETKGVSSRYLRWIIRPVIEAIKDRMPETLNEEIIKKYDLLPLGQAIKEIHFPSSLSMAEKAKQRFSFEQIFFISLYNLARRKEIYGEKAEPIKINRDIVERAESSLPFSLTKAQKRSLEEIMQDMSLPYPMNRLLEGDVGSGKTAVAALASINAVKAKTQVVLMAPTEILAKQHFKTFFEMLKKFNINIGLLTGQEDKYYSKKLLNDTIEISREKLMKKTADGEINILIGTQALIAGTKKTKNHVRFKNLGLVIVDEQHRFGVKQRAALSGKNNDKIPHLLSMTATPIPRTLALTIWGDLSLSVIDEMPQNRKRIITEIVTEKNRNKAYSFIKKQVCKGQQAFIICPRIESEEDEVKTVTKEFERLSKEIFPDLKIGMLHGKMPSTEKDRVMKDFRKGKYGILVSTSVVEVGIDIPNATIMAIEGAEMFGLAQLHQFRGRVGRGEEQSYCLLFSGLNANKSKERLEAMVKYDSGFKLSEIDLKMRGPGDFFGIRQWGLPGFAMSALKDAGMIKSARQAAEETLPEINRYPKIKTRLQAFEEKVHLE